MPTLEFSVIKWSARCVVFTPHQVAVVVNGNPGLEEGLQFECLPFVLGTVTLVGWLVPPFGPLSALSGQHPHLLSWMPGGTVCLSD